jgi:hypothetical protein
MFWPSKIHVSLTGVVSSLFPAWCHLSSSRYCHIIVSCHTSFPWIQAKLVSSASSSDITLSRHLPSRAKTEALNPHHHRRPPSLDRLTLTLHCYKKVLSTLATLPTTQPRLHFASSIARAPHHWRSTRLHRSLSLPSHVHRSSAQRHPRWWTS